MNRKDGSEMTNLEKISFRFVDELSEKLVLRASHYDMMDGYDVDKLPQGYNTSDGSHFTNFGKSLEHQKELLLSDYDFEEWEL